MAALSGPARMSAVAVAKVSDVRPGTAKVVIVAGSPGSNRISFAWGMGAPLTKPILEADLRL